MPQKYCKVNCKGIAFLASTPFLPFFHDRYLQDIMYLQVIIAFCGVIMKTAKCDNVSYFEITACYDSSSSNVLNNKPRVVDVIPGSVVHLWCHYCEEKEEYFPKLWLYKQRGNKTPKELTTNVETNGVTRFSISPSHKLSILNFSLNNSGIYICKSPEVTIKGNLFLYILEGILNIEVRSKVGSYNQWQEYKRSYLDSMTEKLRFSEDATLKSLRNRYHIVFKLTTIWDNWSECIEIDHQKGIRKRFGRCRLQTSVANNTKLSINTLNNNVVISYLTDGYDIPCRSLLLSKTVPEISEIVRKIPDFEMEEACHVLKRLVKHKINKEKLKHKTTKQVAENSHVTLFCSEVIPNLNLKWYKNEKILNSSLRNNMLCRSEEEPHISVDTNNSLHILHISKNEEGNYSCQVNGKTVQEFEVQVVSKSKLLNQEFIRYSIYLGFVLSLTMTCYCAGVCVAWHRRSSFVDPLYVNKKRIHHLLCEREKLLK